MVARKFVVRHHSSDFDVDYDTDDGIQVLKFQLFSLTSIPPDEQQIFSGDDDRLLSDDSDLISVSEMLRLVSIHQDGEQASSSDHGSRAELMKSDEELARMLQAEEEALMLQQFVVEKHNEEFEQRISPYTNQVLMYEDPVRQGAARKTVPIDELEEKALVSLAKEGNFKPSKPASDHAFLLQLLFWFKQSFSWVHAPSCDDCNNETVSQGMGVALPSETQHGATRVELYRCMRCSRTTRFPRYNDPLKLVETRRGRCGEWANCFTLYCRAFNYESRLILDFTDHVWTECFSEHLGRWMHLDPCEGVYDKPLLYEKGWNKKLDYVIAIGKDGVYDVTKRYTRKWIEVLSRRNITTEHALSSVLAKTTKECHKNFDSLMLSVVESRQRSEIEELEKNIRLQEDTSISLPGRQSGDREWRLSRSETATDDKNSLGCNSCPVRICTDEHVTQIYNAFFPLLCRFLEDSFSKSRAVKVLETLKRLMLDLKNSPYKRRQASIDFSYDSRLCFDELLSALSLKHEFSNPMVDICLAGDPVKTALALPVVLDALDEVIGNVNGSDNFDKSSLSLPLVKLNRIHSGSVLASGEELPFGIATAAFDGTRISKWEEPDGARGCWLMYKLLDCQMLELVAYDLMSANDAPERDPMDWTVEGSNDGGSNWRILDKQACQIFENRFQRRTFRIGSSGFLSNAFRFRFLTVRDVESTSRLQLGSIDLYSKSNQP